MKSFAASVFLVIASTAHAGENPMWPTSLTWTCAFSSVIRCERSIDCGTAAEQGEFTLDYRQNSLTDRKGTVHPIKRHYVQTVAGSPIGSEVKIELGTNDVIWLSPADGAYSDDAGRLFRREAGQAFQFDAGHCSDLKPDAASCLWV